MRPLFAEYIGRKHAVAVTSGTAAIMISLWAFGMKPGDKVFIPNYSFPAAFNTCRLQGFDPILIDINVDSMCMSYSAFKEALKDHPDVKTVIWIPHNGFICPDYGFIKSDCNNRGIHFIEDSACGLGCQNKYGIKCGTLGHISTFSFSVPKLITTGQGGMIVTDNDYLADKCREIVDQGSLTWRKDGIHTFAGANFKFTDVQAALGLAQLNNIESILDKKFQIMMEYLNNGIDLCSIQGNSSPWMMTIQNTMVDKIQTALEAHQIQSKKLYKPASYSIKENKKEYPGASEAYLNTLYIPSSLSLKTEEIELISKTILEHL